MQPCRCSASPTIGAATTQTTDNELIRFQLIKSCLFTAVLFSLPATVQAEFLLADIEAGVAPAPIILFADAPPKTRQAAVELADYIEQIFGQRPRLIEGTPKTVPRRAVWVGYQPVLDELFPTVDMNFKHPEEILITATDNHVVIAGRDRWHPEHLTVAGIDEKIVGVQQEYGTVNAVYTFLQEHLGVRWFWPGELGEDVPQRKRFSLKPFEYRYHPQIRARGGAFNFSKLSNRGYGRAQQWTRQQRLQLDSLRVDGGHAFRDWHERFFESNPELFALQPDGTRGTYPRNPRAAKLCQSNPAVWEQWLADVDAILKKDPTRTDFNASPNDSWLSGHCVCEFCRAWDHPDGEPRMMLWKNRRENRPALSDRHVTFANQLAGLLEKRYPDKDYRVTMLSYGHSRPAPVEAQPADNVIIVSVANFFGRTDLVDRGSTRGTTHQEQLAAWGQIAPHVMWRPNTGSPAGWQQGLPDVSIAQTSRNLKFAADNHSIGIQIDAVWEHWATQGPQYYVMAQLIWDPSKDDSLILNDYYSRAFGPAGEHVQRYFETIETARMAYVAKYGYGAGAFNLSQLFTPDLLSESDEHLRRARAAVKNAPKVYLERVEFVGAGLAYTRMLIDNINLMESYWRKKDDAIARQVLANWAAREELCAEHSYAINCGPVRPNTSRMRGLHPDFPNPKWKPNKAIGFDRD